ncbi:MAG: hypothetical protein WBX11_07980 [Thiobacillaceae bacterium]
MNQARQTCRAAQMLPLLSDQESSSHVTAICCDRIDAGLSDLPATLDTEPTVKPLCGHEQGAVISSNPRKPPSRPLAPLA